MCKIFSWIGFYALLKIEFVILTLLKIYITRLFAVDITYKIKIYIIH